MEKETTGLYLTGHPMDEYREIARQYRAAPIGSVIADFAREGGPAEFHDEQRLTIAGVIASVRTKTTRNNTLMAYVMVEDDTGAMEMLAFSRVLGESGSYLKENMAILAEGRISVRDEKAPQLMCDRVRPLTESMAVAEGKRRPRRIYLRLPRQDDPRWKKIQLILTMFPGSEPLKAKFEATDTWSQPLPCQVHTLLVAELQDMLGTENVVVK